MSAAILGHPLWPELRPYFKAEAAGAGDARKQRYRIELTGLPGRVASAALAMEVPCCACGASIHPVRRRSGPGNKRDDFVGHGFYYACACALEVRIGCSRGKPAKANYAAMAAALLCDATIGAESGTA